MTSTLTGVCACGADVSRPAARPGGVASAFMNGLPFVCPACTELAEREEAAQEARAEEQRQAEIKKRRITTSGLPSALAGITWLDIDDSADRGAAIIAAREWAIGGRKGVVLSGPVGAGKTRIAAAAANHLLGRRSLRWMSTALLFARLGSGFGSPQRDKALEALTGTMALVLDDLDKTRPTEYAAEQVFLAIDQRIDNGVPLLVTMNLTLAEVAAKFPEPFGEAIASRLAGYCAYVKVGGRDRRLQPVEAA